MDSQVDLYSSWLDKEKYQDQFLDHNAANAMAATLNQPESQRLGQYLPYLWHWLYFPNVYALSESGEDGHQKMGYFLPPITLPRRMWAGGRLRFERDLVLDAPAKKRSKIQKIQTKKGQSGDLVFVTVSHEVTQYQHLCVFEEHDIVYRQAGGLQHKPSVPNDWQADFRQSYCPNEVMLFRYSALTFNSHRIHYDRTYCLEVEKYTGLVVHGPLIATLLLETLLAWKGYDLKLISFEFKAMSPLIDGQVCEFCVQSLEQTNQVRLWAHHHNQLIMQATAVLA